MTEPNNHTTEHASDCALHNGPAMMPGPCDCGAEPGREPDATTSEMPDPSGWAMERAVLLMWNRNDVKDHHETVAHALDAARAEGRRDALEEAERVTRNLALKLALKRKRGRSVLRVEAAAEYCASRISALMDKENHTND